MFPPYAESEIVMALLQDWIKGQPHPIECDTGLSRAGKPDFRALFPSLVHLAGKLNILLGISLALRYLHQQDKTLAKGPDTRKKNLLHAC